MTSNTNFSNNTDLRLRNFVIDQIKKHLALYNFSEVDQTIFEQGSSGIQEIGMPDKVFAYDTSQNFNQISLQILTPALNSDKTIQAAYLIKILDTLFTEVFKIENYALKINFKSSQESGQESEDQLEALTQLLQILSVSYVVDSHLYPDKSCAFEFVSRSLGAANGFAHQTNGIGAKIDILQLTTLVQQYQNRLLIPEKPALHVIIPVNKEQISLALLLADLLRVNSLSTDVLLETEPDAATNVATSGSPIPTALSAMLQKANKLGAKYVLLIGPDEQNSGMVTVKNMQKNETFSVKQTEIISYLT
jgi:histidyl-tRNA synthetase